MEAIIAVVIAVCSVYIGAVIHTAAREIGDVLREIRNAIKDAA